MRSYVGWCVAWLAAIVATSLVACGGGASAPASDGGLLGDSGLPDGGIVPDGGGAPDAGGTDGGVLDAGLDGGVLFSHPASGGGLIPSAQVLPDGSDADVFAYDDFALAASASIGEVEWIGGYQTGLYGHVTGFTVTFFASNDAGTEPRVSNPQRPDSEIYVARFSVPGNAGETATSLASAVPLYQYRFVLPTPFPASAGTKYWLRIEAAQGSFPDWGLAVGTGGDGKYFRFSTGLAQFQTVAGGDAAFTLR